ncbi:MAG TPA: hypothetical protein VIY66_01190 [Candidatus Acidoferrales bacterium]
MNAAAPGSCRRTPCANSIPTALAAEQLCLDHFLDEAFLRTDQTFDRCRQGRSMNPGDLEWLLADALAIVKNLEEGAAEPNPDQRDRMLELLLILANLNEYVAHHSVRLDRPA